MLFEIDFLLTNLLMDLNP